MWERSTKFAAFPKLKIRECLCPEPRLSEMPLQKPKFMPAAFQHCFSLLSTKQRLRETLGRAVGTSRNHRVVLGSASLYGYLCNWGHWRKITCFCPGWPHVPCSIVSSLCFSLSSAGVNITPSYDCLQQSRNPHRNEGTHQKSSYIKTRGRARIKA